MLLKYIIKQRQSINK